jgi:hypothetical protein
VAKVGYTWVGQPCPAAAGTTFKENTMSNQIQCNEVSVECDRLKFNLTQRGFKRFIGRLFGGARELQVVFALPAGDHKKSVFEHMAKPADLKIARALEDSEHFTVIEKKRSPKNGTVTYVLKASFDENAQHSHLRSVLMDLKDLALRCEEAIKNSAVAGINAQFVSQSASTAA